MQASPALPWAQGTGGTLTLQEPITQEQLLAGALKFTYHNESTDQDYVAGISLNTQANVIQIVELQEGTGQIIGYNHIIQSFAGETSSLQLLPTTGGEPSTLISVQQMSTPIHQFEVWADQSCTIRPQVGQEYERFYVQVNKDVDSVVAYGSELAAYQQLMVVGPTLEAPDDPWTLLCYIDFVSADRSDPFTTGVYVVEIPGAQEPLSPYSPLSVSFGPIVAYTD